MSYQSDADDARESTEASESNTHEDMPSEALLATNKEARADEALVIGAVRVTGSLIQSHPYAHIELGVGLTAALERGQGEQRETCLAVACCPAKRFPVLE